jgi:hypothetical protein
VGPAEPICPLFANLSTKEYSLAEVQRLHAVIHLLGFELGLRFFAADSR